MSSSAIPTTLFAFVVFCTYMLFVNLIISFNLYHSLGYFSRRQIDDISIIFSQETGLDISCKLCPLDTICMKCQILCPGKMRKNVSVCRLLKILPRMLSIKKQVSSRKMHETPTYFWIFKQIPELEYNKAIC